MDAFCVGDRPTCQTATYIYVLHRLDLLIHITPPQSSTYLPPAAARLIATTDPKMAQPKITLLSLDKEAYFDEMFSNTLTALKAKASVTEITTPSEASTLFATRGTDMPKAVLATDAALASFIRDTTCCSGCCIATDKPLQRCAKCHSVAYCDRKCQKQHWGSRHKMACSSLADEQQPALAEQAASFVRAGGRVIFMGTFSGFARPLDIGLLFSLFGLPWKSGDYHRADFQLNPDVTDIDITGLSAGYSQKALHLQDVRTSDAVYLSSGVSYSPVFGANAVDASQSPAVFGSCREGKVGYVGDVNNEQATTPVVLAMCGLAAT